MLYNNMFKIQILETISALNIFNHLVIKMNERINFTKPILSCFEWKVNGDCCLFLITIFYNITRFLLGGLEHEYII